VQTQPERLEKSDPGEVCLARVGWRPLEAQGNGRGRPIANFLGIHTVCGVAVARRELQSLGLLDSLKVRGTGSSG